MARRKFEDALEKLLYMSKELRKLRKNTEYETGNE